MEFIVLVNMFLLGVIIVFLFSISAIRSAALYKAEKLEEHANIIIARENDYIVSTGSQRLYKLS